MEHSASRQAILEVFDRMSCGLSPCDVQKLIPTPVLLTSVRSDMTRLTELGMLVKTDETKIGIYGKPVYRWELKSKIES